MPNEENPNSTRGIRVPWGNRNRNAEKTLVLKNIAEFHLLNKLSDNTRIRHLFPTGIRRGNFFVLDNRSIVIKDHGRSFSEINKAIRNNNKELRTHQQTMMRMLEFMKSLDETLSCLQNVTSILKEHTDALISHSNNILSIRNSIKSDFRFYRGTVFIEINGEVVVSREPHPLLSTYANHHGVDEDVAMAILGDQLGISEFMSGGQIPPGKGWESVYSKVTEGDAFLQGFKIVERYDFKGKHGQVVRQAVEVKSGDKVLVLPVTSWIKNGLQKTYSFILPFRRPYPLYNLDLLATCQDIEVWLTDNLALAKTNQPTLEASSSLPKVFLSWLGGRQAVSNVDWSPLLEIGKPVKYVFANHSGYSEEEMRQTAMAVHENLLKIGVEMEIYKCECEPAGKN